jgi:hypothetical protein
VSQVLSVCGLILEAASSIHFLSQGGWMNSSSPALLAGVVALLPAAHIVSGKVFDWLTGDPAADLAMQEAWAMPIRR